jgi:2-octaprenylphenol hydroxylase
VPVDKPHYDVIVVGAGLVGMSCALALSQQGLSVCLFDSKPQPDLREAEPDEDNWDSRIYAISPANASWLASMGVWQRLDAGRICPIAQMQIFGDAASRLEFDASEAHVENLGFIVESRQLEAALMSVLVDSSVHLKLGIAPKAAIFTQQQAGIHLADEQLSAELIVAADGAHSWLRHQAGIAVTTHDYHQQGVVANFETEISPRHVAYQWFDHHGVLAFLPLPGNRMSMVWSVDEIFAKQLLELPAESLSDRVGQQVSMQLGKLKLLTEARAFPLKQQTADSLVQLKLALVGDAAHTVHPLAGQGVNLGFRDVIVLAETLQNRNPQQRYGDLMLLRRYERARKADIMAMKSVTRGLSELFLNPHDIVRTIRNRGLNLTNQQAGIKKYLMQQAIR